MKRYEVHFSGNRDHSGCMPAESILPYDDEVYGRASSLKTAKGYIARLRLECASMNPHSIRIYDMYADKPYAEGCVYQED